jgi:mannose-6-phosphate isomerase-like protein (cupin superfamily)
MRITEAPLFTADRPWGAIDIARIDSTSVRLHWTDQPYVWHVNDGPEVFIVLDGEVDMQFRQQDREFSCRLRPGQIAYLDEGDAHRAVPIGAARILVIERTDSI